MRAKPAAAIRCLPCYRTLPPTANHSQSHLYCELFAIATTVNPQSKPGGTVTMQTVSSLDGAERHVVRTFPTPQARYRPRRGWLRLAGAGLAWAVSAQAIGPAHAAPPVVQLPTDESLQPSETGAQSAVPLGFLNGISRSNYMLGDMWGLRSALSQYGITFALTETSEVLGNPTGGQRQGADYDGLTQMVVQLDTKRAFGWYGGTFNVSALQIHGRDLSTDNLLTLQTASGIEADRSTRLWELWYQQKFLEEDRLDIKVGQQSLDQEFMVSQNALLFVNTMFGWPMVPSADLPGGGPAYPLSDLGVRVRAKPTDSLTVLAGVFNGSPVSNGLTGDPQEEDATGTAFPLNGGALAIAEIQYNYPAVGALVSPDDSDPLARVYKLGFWYDTERFSD